MSTPPDGFGPTLKLGLVAKTGRHTAFDASVVFHEATHGLTNRLVGGPVSTTSLVQPQSAALGEGWSDFFACQLLGVEVIGDWVTSNPDGIRLRRYDDAYPATFADLGTAPYTEMHNVGEIWCATLARIAATLGLERSLRLVLDSLKLLPDISTLLDARDGMIEALDHSLQAGVVRSTQADRRIWRSAGMGSVPCPAMGSFGLTGGRGVRGRARGAALWPGRALVSPQRSRGNYVGLGRPPRAVSIATGPLPPSCARWDTAFPD